MSGRRYSLSSNPTAPVSFADNFESASFIQHHQQQQQQLRMPLRRGAEPSLRHLDQELSVLGLPSLFLTSAGGGHDLDVSALASACQQLVALYHRSRDAREALEDRNRRLESELRDSRRSEQRLQEAARESASQSAGLRERERRMDERGRRLNDQLRAAREEVKRLSQQFQQRDVQYRHEQRKLSKEADQLRERLQAGLSNRLGTLRLSCIEVLNQLPRTDGRRAAWARVSSAAAPLSRLTASDDRAHYSSLLAQSDQGQLPRFQRNYQNQLESRQAELAAENQELRDSLFRVHRQLRELQLLSLAKAASSGPAEQDENADAGAETEDEELHDGLLKLPYQLLKDRLDRQLKAGCDRLRARLERPANGESAKDSNGADATAAADGGSPLNGGCGAGDDSLLMREQMRQLKERLSSYEELMHRQEQLIKRSLATSSAN